MPEDNRTLDELWQRYAVTRDVDTKNLILPYYFQLVKSIVFRLMPKFGGYTESDDLISCGMLGLIDAVEKFDINFGVKFETYATTRVRGEILDYMRKQDWAPASLRKKISQINSAYDALEHSLNRHPTDNEVAQYLGMPPDDIHDIMAKTQMFNLMYFEDMVNENSSSDSIAVSDGENPENIAETRETKKILTGIIEDLPEKERTIITLYYYEELTLRQIADILNISESRVSQIHSKVLARIGFKLNKSF